MHLNVPAKVSILLKEQYEACDGQLMIEQFFV